MSARTYIFLLFTMALCGLSSCESDSMSDHTLVQNDEFTVTGDSVIQGYIIASAATPFHIESSLTKGRLDSIAKHFPHGTGDEGWRPRFVGGKPWRAEAVNDKYPQFSSKQSLIVALYNMSVDQLAELSVQNTFATKTDTIGLYCSIFMSLAVLDPDRSMATLRQMTENDKVKPCGQWPIYDGRLAWAAAAWEVYNVTGDRNWLLYIRKVIQNTLNDDAQARADKYSGLWHGAATYKPHGFYPQWMNGALLWQCMSLQNNVLAVKAQNILEAIDEELNGEKGVSSSASGKKQQDAVNQQLWNERLGHYSAYLYGEAYPTQAPVCDNMAQALAVLWDVADDDRATTLMAKTPITHRGITFMHPQQLNTEPYFSHPSWTTLQGLWNLAAARAGNQSMAQRGLGALYRAQALFTSRHIYIEGIPQPDYLASAASNTAMIYKLITGMTFTPEGIEFSPMVPACMKGDKTISGFRYRQAVLDITLRGTGNAIDAITLDEAPLEGNFLPANTKGKHQLLITLKQQSPASREVTIANPNITLPSTPDVVWNADSACIVNFVVGGGYRLIVNGERASSISEMALTYLPQTGTTEVGIVAGNKFGYGFISQTAIASATPPISYAVTDTVSADSVSVTVNVPQAGSYFLQTMYQPTDDDYCIMLVYANSHLQGSVLLSNGDNIELLSANLIHLRLLKGNNLIIFRRFGSNGSKARPKNVYLYQK